MQGSPLIGRCYSLVTNEKWCWHVQLEAEMQLMNEPQRRPLLYLEKLARSWLFLKDVMLWKDMLIRLIPLLNKMTCPLHCQVGAVDQEGLATYGLEEKQCAVVHCAQADQPASSNSFHSCGSSALGCGSQVHCRCWPFQGLVKVRHKYLHAKLLASFF